MDEGYYYDGYSKNFRSGQIPAFGDWDYANDLPITQYFDCARHAGLIRFSSSSGECDPRAAATTTTTDLYTPPRKTRPREKQKKAGRISDVVQPPTKLRHAVSPPRSDEKPHRLAARAKPPKAVDEDLYKIPPELHPSAERKKMLGFISRCLVPDCST
ncbi:hypothetical protein SAY86_013756 [Trapa natans]|uniref:Uncharacterized protein n=1 Tax=Trapa natans TaxID=22666 RepID=A0AAN7KZ93_TRANT|nr:hypothetical protein SAY86_013756 [Trapa natans]